MTSKKTNKDLIQSYILTTAKYDFSVWEKRILYRIVELNQHLIEGKKLNKNYNIEQVNEGVYYTLPISSLLKNATDKNHKQVKAALRSLQKKTIEFQDDRYWASINIIANPKIEEYSDTVRFYVDELIYKPLLDFSKGFRKYELKTAMQFESVYSMRFYELLSEKKQPITYNIDSLKEMFCIEGKYSRINDFKRYVLDVAKKELDSCSPYTFDYTMNKIGRSYSSVTLKPKFQPEHRDEDLETSYIQSKQDTSWYLGKEEKEYLVHNMGFTQKGIKNNAQLFEDIKPILVKNNTNLIEALADIKTRGLKNGAKNIQGYTIKALKSILEHQDEPMCLKSSKSSKNARKGESRSIGDLLNEYKK
jgi:plasmid replication initiation protein